MVKLEVFMLGRIAIMAVLLLAGVACANTPAATATSGISAPTSATNSSETRVQLLEQRMGALENRVTALQSQVSALRSQRPRSTGDTGCMGCTAYPVYTGPDVESRVSQLERGEKCRSIARTIDSPLLRPVC